VKQLSGEYKFLNPKLIPYYQEVCELMKQFVDVTIMHVPKIENEEANDLAQVTLGYKLCNQTRRYQNMIASADL